MSSKKTNNFAISSFSINVIKATSIILLMLMSLFFVLKGFKVLLLILAGILVATFFKGIASLIQKKLPIGDKWALGIGTTLFIIICTATIFLLSPRVSSQIDELEKKLPVAAAEAKTKIKTSKVGSLTLGEVENYMEKVKDGSSKITVFFSSFFGGLADLYIIVFLGLFMMIQPDLYKNGIIILFPKSKRKRAEEVLLTLGYTLKRWLLGKIFSMLVVGVLTFIGLTILGIPLALTLGIFAAVVTFIPNFGPIISLVPTLLIAMAMGTDQIIYVIILYMLIQAIESNVITPVIQSKMISFPLAMILIAQVILGIFTGALGLMLAVPVIAIVMVLIKMVYIEDILGDTNVEVQGEELFVRGEEIKEESINLGPEKNNNEV